QAIYLEDPTGTRAEPFAQALAAALDALADTLPMGALDLHERAEITKERELAVAREVLGQGRLYVPTRPGRLQAWTLMLDREPAFGLSPLCRTIAVKPVGDLSDAVAALAPWRAYLQTCGLAVAPARLGALSDALIGAGAHRVTRVGEMSNGAPGEPHDGVFGLGELVRWASLDAPDAAERFDGAGLVGTAEAASRSWARRRRLVEGLLPQAPRWQERLAGVQLASEADWLALPLMDRADLTAGTPPASQALLTGGEAPPHGGHWLRTGGSSGDPRLSIYGFEDYEADMVRAARGAWAAGIRPGERVANLFFTGDLYGSFLSVNRALELIGANAFSLTQTAPVESVLTCLRSFGIETVVGLSTNVQHVLAHVAEAPAGIRVRRVYYAGEPFHEAERERLRETLGVERIASIGYGGVDAGPMGYACPACVGNEHHVHDDHVFVEILDPATGRPCAPGERGEVVITSLNRRAMPLLRYRVGDLARWLPGACPCGLASPRLELLGRVEDLVRLGARRLDYGEIQAVVAARPAVASNPQLVLTGGEALTVRVEAMDASADPTGVAAAIRADLLAQVAGLGAGPLDVVVVPLGGLERVGRTGKVIRVLDRRPTP
ncbi:MAG: acyl-CoA reductase, partial [Candidatus Sericytochromatia bacterium]|nr:acyl-CoA reductase [Candidatus Sericytochromatia bacterium]